MAHNIDRQYPGTAKCMLWIFGYVVAFAVPTALLVWLLPTGYAPWIVLPAGFLFFAVASFRFGIEWDLPPTPDEGKSFLRLLPLVILLTAAISTITDRSFLAFGLTTAFVAAAIYPPFFFGRFIGRRRQNLHGA